MLYAAVAVFPIAFPAACTPWAVVLYAAVAVFPIAFPAARIPCPALVTVCPAILSKLFIPWSIAFPIACILLVWFIIKFTAVPLSIFDKLGPEVELLLPNILLILEAVPLSVDLTDSISFFTELVNASSFCETSVFKKVFISEQKLSN